MFAPDKGAYLFVFLCILFFNKYITNKKYD